MSWWELAEQARKGGNQNCPRLVVLDRCDNVTLYRITLKNSPNFHVSYRYGSGFTAWGVIIDTPKTARNTYGIDPGPASNVTIKAGGKCDHMAISHNHFYTGHGMSIGSETDGGADTIRQRPAHQEQFRPRRQGDGRGVRGCLHPQYEISDLYGQQLRQLRQERR
ncbi:MAG TPA: glycosyl hydrolase family 28 protein [Candidatus Acidoferrum sp.]|nr:glycosyl hydrolase family 28 protein [Candidatus Acidoferrum sp.]